MINEFKINTILNYLNENDIDYEFIGNADEFFEDYSTLFNYKESSMTFISTLNQFKDYKDLFINKQIQLIIMGPDEEQNDSFINIIKVEKPKSTFFNLLDYFYGDPSKSNHVVKEETVYNKHSYVSNQAEIGENVRIGVGSVIEDGVFIGDNTIIHHNVTIRKNTKIGERCTISSGVVIGESGFNPLRKENNERILIKHYGGVTIEDDVHIGDNCTISKGTIEDTIIKQGAKLNKQITVAHNVKIGKNTVITTPTFIGGSVIIGDNCHIAATAIRNQCEIGDGAVLGLGSVVVKDVKPGMTVVGVPAKPITKDVKEDK